MVRNVVASLALGVVALAGCTSSPADAPLPTRLGRSRRVTARRPCGPTGRHTSATTPRSSHSSDDAGFGPAAATRSRCGRPTCRMP